MFKKTIVGVVVVIVLLLGFSSFYIQNADEQTAIIRMSQLNRIVLEPGIHFKAPIIESRIIYTKRTIEYDAPPLAVTTKDKKTIVFDIVSFSRITDPAKFYVKFKTIDLAQQYFDDVVYASVRNEVGSNTFDGILFEDKQGILNRAVKYTNDKISQYGAVVDSILFKRVTLPKDNEESIYRSMIAERQQISAQIKAEGDAKSVEIQSRADKDYIQTISEAKRKAAEIKGTADAKAQAMIEQVNRQAPGLYLFIKNLEFYKNNMEGTVIITKPGEGILKDLLNK